MIQKLNVELSTELEPYRSLIETTIKPYIKIQLTNNNKPTWWQSKFGGFPYLPRDFDYPKSNDGEYLYLLAQFNFAEVPSIDGLPEKGILQFYVADDGFYGCDNDDIYHKNYNHSTYQKNFKIIYFSDIKRSEQELVTDFSFIPSQDTSLPFTFNGSTTLDFTLEYSPASVDEPSFNFFEYLLDENEDKYWRMFEEYNKKFNARGHKLLGYLHRIQEDIRDYLPEDEEPYILLLQIDNCTTKNGFNIEWREEDNGNFFIKKSDLEKLDFTKVIYNWDY